MGIVESRSAASGRSGLLVSWKDLKVSDSGKPVDIGSFVSGSLQASGSFGAGGCVVLEGSIDGVNYVPLLTKYSSAVGSIDVPVRYLRPSVPSGDEHTSINLNLLINRGA